MTSSALCLAGVLRGMGKQRLLLLYNIIGFWLGGMIPGYIMTFYFDLGLKGYECTIRECCVAPPPPWAASRTIPIPMPWLSSNQKPRLPLLQALVWDRMRDHQHGCALRGVPLPDRCEGRGKARPESSTATRWRSRTVMSAAFCCIWHINHHMALVRYPSAP